MAMAASNPVAFPLRLHARLLRDRSARALRDHETRRTNVPESGTAGSRSAFLELSSGKARTPLASAEVMESCASGAPDAGGFVRPQKEDILQTSSTARSASLAWSGEGA